MNILSTATARSRFGRILGTSIVLGAILVAFLVFQENCQGRSKTRPVRRGKSRPVEQLGDRGLSGRRTAGAKACAA